MGRIFLYSGRDFTAEDAEVRGGNMKITL